jgi:hypothetical protein
MALNYMPVKWRIIAISLLLFTSVAHAQAPVIDGAGCFGSASSSKTVSCTFSSSGPNDVVLVFSFGLFGIPNAITTNCALALRDRLPAVGGTGSRAMYEVGGVNGGPINNCTVTAAATTNTPVLIQIAVIVFSGVSGSSPTWPFDTNYFYGPAYETLLLTGLATNNADDCIVAFYPDMSITNPTAGSGWTQFTPSGLAGNSVLIEYKCFTSTQSGLTAPIGTGVNNSQGIGEAVVGTFAPNPAWTHSTVPQVSFGTNLGVFSGGGGVFNGTAEQPFNNMMLYSQAGGNIPNTWQTINSGGADVGQEWCVPVDGNGYPTSLTATTGMPGCSPVTYTGLLQVPLALVLYPNGPYTLAFDGTGAVTATNRLSGTDITSVGSGCGTAISPVTTGNCQVGVTATTAGFNIVILSTDPNSTGDYVRNIRFVLTSNYAATQAGEVINPAFKTVVAPFCAFRTMDWLETLDNLQTWDWDDIPPSTSAGWGDSYGSGATFNGYVAPATANTSTMTVTSMDMNSFPVQVSQSILNMPTASNVQSQASGTPGGAGVYTVTGSYTAGSSGSPIAITTYKARPVPYAAVVAEANSGNQDVWLNFPFEASINSTDVSPFLGAMSTSPLVFNAATYLLDNLNPWIKIYQENGNEFWQSVAQTTYVVASNVQWGGQTLTGSISGTTFTPTSPTSNGLSLQVNDTLTWSGGSTVITAIGSGFNIQTFQVANNESTGATTFTTSVNDNYGFFGHQTKRECQELKTVFGVQSPRIICVMAAQTGNYSILQAELSCVHDLWPCDKSAGIDAGATAPYFGYQVPDAWNTLDGGSCGTQCVTNIIKEMRFGGMSSNQTGTSTMGSQTVTGLDTTQLSNAMSVTGPCVNGSEFFGIENATTIGLAQNATTSGSCALSFVGPAGGMVPQELAGVSADANAITALGLVPVWYEMGNSAMVSTDPAQSNMRIVSQFYTGSTAYGNMRQVYQDYYGGMYSLGALRGNQYNSVSPSWGMTLDLPSYATAPEWLGATDVQAAHRIAPKGYPCSSPSVGWIH